MPNPYGTDKALHVGTTPYYNVSAVTLLACILNITVTPIKNNIIQKEIYLETDV